MNIFSRIPSLNKDEGPELTPEEQAAEDKKARIKFHREHVRNGPSNFRVITNGQARRAQQRAAKRRAKQNYRREVRNYFAQQREAATIRGNLQAAGVIPFLNPETQFSAEGATRAVNWILERFVERGEDGTVEITEEVIRNALRNALNRYQSIVGLPKTGLPSEES